MHDIEKPIPWNKGLTKETSEIIKLMSKKVSNTLKMHPTPGTASTPELEDARKKKISETMKKNKNAGGYRKGSGRGKKDGIKDIFVIVLGNLHILCIILTMIYSFREILRNLHILIMALTISIYQTL